MASQFHYFIAGLTVSSEIELPRLPEWTGDSLPDVRICCGNVPDQLPDVVDRGPVYQTAPGQLLFRIEAVAAFYVCNGNEIVVQPAPQATDSEVRLFLLGSALGALLHQRELFPLHASAVRVGSGCVAFVGDSGKGKSTLCAALAQQGYALLCDDICPLEVIEGKTPALRPGVPRLKLWEDAVEWLQIPDDETGPAVRQNLKKYEVTPRNRDATSSLPIHRLYLLCETHDEEDEGITAVTGADRLKLLIDNTYRLRFLKGFGLRTKHFQQSASLAQTLSIHRLTRRRGLEYLPVTIDCLKRDFATLTSDLPESPEVSCSA